MSGAFAQRLLVGFLFLLVASCSDTSSGAKLVSVTGKVMVGDQLLTRGSVLYRPEAGGTAPEPYGSIGADGTYTLFTNGKQGAPAGKYFVIIESTAEIDPSNASATPKSLIDIKYADGASKLIPMEVMEGATEGKYDIKLSR